MARTGHWNDSDFALDVDAAYVQGPSARSKVLLFFIVLFLGVAGGWAHFAVLDEVTHAEGKVVPSSTVQVVQNLEGGILKEILVSDGGIVEKGQVLLRIDDTGVASSYGEIQANRYSLLGRVERLEAEAAGKPLEFSPILTTDYPDVARGQRDLYDARQAELQSQQAILHRQIEQRKQEAVELKAKLGQLRKSLSITREEFDLTKPLADKGVVPKVNVLRLRRDISDLEGEISAARLARPRAAAAIKEAERRLEEKFLNFRAQALRELAETRADLGRVTESITAAKDRVVRTEVRSPVKGVVKEIKIRTLGGVIKPGADLVEIVPIEDTLLVEARIKPQDIAFLSPDQEAVVKLTAYDFAMYGGLPGKLEQIAADTYKDEQGEEFYRVMVRTDRNFLTRGTEHLPIIPGMIATVDVITGQKSVLTYLLKPVLRARDRALTER